MEGGGRIHARGRAEDVVGRGGNLCTLHSCKPRPRVSGLDKLAAGFALKTLHAMLQLKEVYESAKKYYYTYTTNLMFCNTFFLPIIIFASYFQNGFIIEKLSFFISCVCGCIYLLAKLIMLNRLNLFSITSMFYNILYLCALEVLPYLVLFTVLELIN